jgi:DNA-binding MarR family transcriptional regulator
LSSNFLNLARDNLDVKILLTENLNVVTKQQDYVDRFLATVERWPVDLDLEVEGIVDRINGLSRRFKRGLEETASEHGLTLGGWEVLGWLFRAGEPYRRSPGKLAEQCKCSSGAMTNRLDGLEDDRLVRRLRDPDDRRGVLVELTSKGRKAWTDSVSAGARKEALIAGVLTERQKKQLNGLLRRLMLEFEGREGAPSRNV